jgi:Flp pilus assembly protein TadG
MIIRKRNRSREDGFALFYMAVVTTAMLMFTGLAMDSGRSYLVKAQLSKAVDGAALGAARSLNSGNPKNEAIRIFKANFPPGYLGTLTDTDPTLATDFYQSTVIQASGTNVVTVTARAKLPTTFMKLGHTDEVLVRSTGEATRRMVDLSMVVDVSSSIGWRWPYVRDAVKNFIGAFDRNNDRLALLTFSNGVSVLDQMPGSRGFDKPKLIADVPTNLPGGSTNMVEGLYRGWDELRAVPSGQQSGLRVLVLFTDGASNSVPGNYEAAPGLGRSFRTWDFPDNGADPDNQTHANPHIDGLYPTSSATASASPSYSLTTAWNSTAVVPQVPQLPLTSWHAYHRSSGIPTTFPLQTNALTVNGQSQILRRGLRQIAGNGRYPAQVFNINNAARNLVEIISNAARSDNGDYKIRIYTIGMGELVQYDLGTRPEKSSEILKRMANDKLSPDFNPNQLEGKFYYAQTPDDVAPAFAALQNQIIRLTK